MDGYLAPMGLGGVAVAVKHIDDRFVQGRGGVGDTVEAEGHGIVGLAVEIFLHAVEGRIVMMLHPFHQGPNLLHIVVIGVAGADDHVVVKGDGIEKTRREELDTDKDGHNG